MPSQPDRLQGSEQVAIVGQNKSPLQMKYKVKWLKKKQKKLLCWNLQTKPFPVKSGVKSVLPKSFPVCFVTRRR